jgi:hypothetical protein
VINAKAIEKLMMWNRVSFVSMRPLNSGAMSAATPGSPIQPRPSDAIVIPTWQAERYESM